jgi:hypothetical protein
MRAPRVWTGVFRRPHIAALALLALAVLLAACKGDSEPLPPLTPFEPALLERLHEIRDRAVEVRGLAAYDEVEEGWFTEETLRAYNERDEEAAREEMGTQLEAWNIAWRLLHLMGPDDDLLDASTTFEGSVVGRYYPSLNKLALIFSGEEITPEDELILVHEYVHSFQDGRWDIEEMNKLVEKDDDENSSSEFATTISCLIEGDAMLAMILYAEEVYGPDWIDEIYGGEEGEDPEPEPDEELPPALERFFYFNYSECVGFVAAIYAWGGWEAVNDLYDDPPRSTEAILHPDRYLADKDIGSIVPLAELHHQLEGWDRLSLAPFGEFDVLVYLATILEDETATAAASTGWDGGRSAVYTKEDDDGDQQILVHIGLAFDTDADRDEFLRAFQDVVAKIAASQESGDASVSWTEESAFGRAWWDVERFRRFDLLMGNDAGALNAAAAAAGAPGS